MIRRLYPSRLPCQTFVGEIWCVVCANHNLVPITCGERWLRGFLVRRINDVMCYVVCRIHHLLIVHALFKIIVEIILASYNEKIHYDSCRGHSMDSGGWRGLILKTIRNQVPLNTQQLTHNKHQTKARQYLRSYSQHANANRSWTMHTQDCKQQ